eukprot:SAG31_NODE_10769_length_1099_cov_207.108000_1_plen_116_part_10
MTIVAATFFFTTIPVGYAASTLPVGWLTDRCAASRKLIVGAGLGLSGAVYVAFGFVSHGGTAPFEIGALCVLMGLVCPMLMVPVLPDMHACRRSLPADASEEELEDATNLVSSLCE